MITLPSSAMLHTPAAFGEKYQPVPPVVKELTQVVYYRANSPVVTAGPANVYVDARYHTSLLPGGFTSFCLRPGNHTLGAYVNDPLYRGKNEHPYQADLHGGRTYYLRVDEQQHIAEAPLAVNRQHGEKEIKPNHRQVHAHSRALTIVPCVYDRAAAQNESEYLLSSKVLFNTVGGVISLSDEGQNSINEVVVTLRQQHPVLHRVVIRLISPNESQIAQQQKAKALNTALTLAAIPSELLSIQKISCFENCPALDQDVQILAK